MSVTACAEIVERADPDRFRAVLAAPSKAHAVLFPIYAFNVEVARAPWASAEPLIAEMRLQWWRDALEEIRVGGPVRRHEVTTPLSEAVPPDVTLVLEQVIDARRWDISAEPHHTVKALTDYIDRTAGSLMWAGALALGAPEDTETEDLVRDAARAVGLVRYFGAVPTLEARGRQPLPLGLNLQNLAQVALDDMPDRRTLRRALPMPARAVTFDVVGAERALAAVVRKPKMVERGQVALPQLRRRIGLLRRSIGV